MSGVTITNNFNKAEENSTQTHGANASVGYTTGEMAAKILTGEADISTTPVGYAATTTKKYNAEICEDLGLTAPEGYVAIG